MKNQTNHVISVELGSKRKTYLISKYGKSADEIYESINHIFACLVKSSAYISGIDDVMNYAYEEDEIESYKEIGNEKAELCVCLCTEDFK